MPISQVDMVELRRIVTNTYDADKACMRRIILGISEYEKQIRDLKAEKEALAKELAAVKAAAPQKSTQQSK